MTARSVNAAAVLIALSSCSQGDSSSCATCCGSGASTPSGVSSTNEAYPRAPSWNAESGECEDHSFGPDDFNCLLPQHLGPEIDPGGAMSCATHEDCSDDEFCGAGFCRSVDESVVTVCLRGVSIVGGPSSLAAPWYGSPPDLDITWSSSTGGLRGIVQYGPWEDTCELYVGGGCRLWPLHKIPGSLVEVFELPSVTTRSRHYVGDLEEVLDRMDTCYEVPPEPYPYTLAETHVWVTISYP